MQIHILTLFPEMFAGPLESSILGRALARGQVAVRLHNVRDYAHDRHRTVDDYPYGGAPGMVMKPEPLFEAAEAALGEALPRERPTPVILMTPQGRPFTQQEAERLAHEETLVLVCGHYEGVDERVRQHLVTQELSIGDYVLTGGELAALVVVDAVARLLPGVLGTAESAADDSFTTGLLQCPLYTRPSEFRGWGVPEALLSGNHPRIARWRREESLRRTWLRRPDLLAHAPLSAEDHRFLEQLQREAGEQSGSTPH